MVSLDGDIKAHNFSIYAYATLSSFPVLAGFDMLDDDKMSAVWWATIISIFALLSNLHHDIRHGGVIICV